MGKTEVDADKHNLRHKGVFYPGHEQHKLMQRIVTIKCPEVLDQALLGQEEARA